MNKIYLTLVLLLTACGPSIATIRYELPPNLPNVVDSPLPDSPDKVAIPDAQNYAIPLVKGMQSPQDGILISPELAKRVKLWQLDDQEIRALYQLDKNIWKAEKVIFDERLAQSNQTIQTLMPNSWWYNHKDSFIFIGGIIVGTVTTSMVVYGLKNL
jgi:hypothetical protein